MQPTKQTLAELAVVHPGASRVFFRHRLDFCCGGRRSLEDACREHGLDPIDILSEIDAARPLGAEDAPRWEAAPLPALIDHIVSTYHERLRRDLPDLIEMARRVERKHGEKPGCPVGLTAHLEEMQLDVLEHLQKEELILFPMIERGASAAGAGPVQVMEKEHEHHRESLLRLRQLTGDLEPPAAACATWRALYDGLRQLEQELMEHIHLENNVLFPRSVAA
jgi:regulator of cell morphogenesis and NO signaling